MIRSQSGHIEGIDQPRKFRTQLSYYTADPIENIEAPEYFLNSRQHLNAGDVLIVMLVSLELLHQIEGSNRIEKAKWSEAEFRVIEATEENVIVRRLGDWHVFASGKFYLDPPEPAPDQERYVPADAEAVHQGHGKFAVVVNGEKIVRGLDKMTAEAMARGDTPLPDVGPEMG